MTNSVSNSLNSGPRGYMTVNIAIKSSDKKTKDAAYFSKIMRRHLPKLKQEYNISYLGIFGSYIRGEQTEDNDLDILVEFSKNLIS